MKKEISITIDSCSVNPENMLKTENGKFCLACSKNVVDFTQMSDNEIIQYLSKNSENQCGTFKKTQIDRVLVESEKASFRNYFTKTISFFSSLLILSTYNQTFANSNTTRTQTKQFENNNFKEIEKSDSSKNVVKGKVIDFETKEPLIGASVNLVGTNIRKFADENGEFAIDIPDSMIGKPLSIEAFYVGFGSTILSFKANESPYYESFIIEMKESNVILGGICVTEKKYSKRTWFQKLFGINKNKWK